MIISNITNAETLTFTTRTTQRAKPRYTQLDPEFIGLDFGQGSTNACILGKVWQLP